MWNKTGTPGAKHRRLVGREKSSEQFEAPEKYVGYKVRDPLGKKIGRVAELSTNRYGEPESVRVRVGFLRLRSVLIPTMFIKVDRKRRTVTLQ
jgi:hypothetical protein